VHLFVGESDLLGSLESLESEVWSHSDTIKPLRRRRYERPQKLFKETKVSLDDQTFVR
jgi:hypothetical protein